MIKKAAAHCFVFFLSCAMAQAQVFVPKTNEPVQPLSGYLQVREDKNNVLTIEQLLSGQPLLSFQSPATVKSINVKSTWWVKLDMLPSFSSDDFYIGLPKQEKPGLSQGNDNADVWIVTDQHIIARYKTGNLTPVSQRPVARPVNHNLFPVSLKEKQPITIYWRISRTVNFEPLQFKFVLQHSSVINTATPSDKLAWFYTGLMMILFIFGLVFFIITREKSFIWFTCIAATLSLHMQLLNPENNLTQWLLSGYPVYQYHLFTLFTSGFGILILQFTRSFAKTKQLLRRWDKVILGIMLFIALLAATSLTLLEINPAVGVPDYFFMVAFAGTIVIAVRLMLTKDLYARWSGFALLWLFAFQILGLLWNNNVLPSWFPNPWAIAQFGMMIIFFFGLAYRFKQSAKEKAEAAKVLEMDTIKSRFFANISHEFRTPLTLMLGPLKQMEGNTVEAGQQKKYLSMMRRNGDRLLQLINQLLDLSKLESGKMELQVVKTDITGLLKAIASSFDSLAEQNQVNYHVHFPEENIMGYADRDKLEKVVVNLLSNAFRFTAANGTVSFSVERDEKRLRFTVQDNGVGMSKEQLNKIFDRFHQVAGTEGGTGIGLSLAKELLQLHKGQISVQSETGKGSSFRVSIPVAPEFYSAAEMTPASYPLRDAATTSNNGAITSIDAEEENMADTSLPLVLVTEDNTDLQQYISDTLRPHFQVQVAANGKIGLQKAIEWVPDCIISDVMMPEMDGIELCTRLKKEPATNHIPVILLTAKAGSSSRIEGLQTGADDYLVKPFDGAELILRIQNLIEQRKQLRERYSKQVFSIQPDAIITPSAEQEFINTVRRIIEENIDNELFGVAELANAIPLSRSQLHRKLKALTGQAPNELVRNYRLERALQLLQQHSGNISEVAFQTGFSSPAYFSKCFSDRYGYAPGEVRKKV